MHRSSKTSHTYEADYFHGVTSGYPQSGYSTVDFNWAVWLDLISSIVPPGVKLLDLGTAFGYLPVEAVRRGYEAVGVDISAYALTQESRSAGLLLRGDGHEIPFPAQTFGVVTAFDVLEHLEDPVRCLREIRRVLDSDGLLVAATPDPLFFDRTEPTHCFERPPSFWISALRDLGMEVHFRISELPYNFQLLAAIAGSPTARRIHIFQHDYFGEQADFLETDSAVRAVPRQGWGPLKEGGRLIQDRAASVYVLNLSGGPRRLTVSGEISHGEGFSTLQVRLDSHVLTEIHLTTEQTSSQLHCENVPLPTGGHHLTFELSPAGPQVTVAHLKVDSAPMATAELTETLPFDLYQRYRLCADIVRILKPRRLLDVGGLIGDRSGHLATPADFFCDSNASCGPVVVSTDLRQCDEPSHIPADAPEQPFEDRSFDLVLSLDILEHLPESRRNEYLSELDRVSGHWIILGAPFDSEAVRASELELRRTADLNFLKEHELFGLPSLEDTRRFYANRNYEVRVLSNGFLPRWLEAQQLTQLYFAFKSLDVSSMFNRLCNQNCFAFDQLEPSYRQVLLISKTPLDGAQGESLLALASQRSHPAEMSCQELMARDERFSVLMSLCHRLLSERRRALHDANFLLNARDEGIRLLLRELNQTPFWRLALRRLRERWTRR